MSASSAPRTLFLVVTAAAAIAAGCGGGTPTPAEPGGTGEPPDVAGGDSAMGGGPEETGTGQPDGPDEGAAVAPMAWADMNRDQKMQHMKDVVMPQMAKVFQAADAKKYAEMNCGTCHGPDAKKTSNYDMPTAALPKLNPAGSFKSHMDKHPEVTKFMMNTVVPEMAKSIDVEPYNPETNSGEMGCFNCHMKAE